MRFVLVCVWLIGCDNSEAPRNMEGDAPGECTDRADNDQDGRFDCEDSDCFGSPDCKGASTPKPKAKQQLSSRATKKSTGEYKSGKVLTSKLRVKTVYVPSGSLYMGASKTNNFRKVTVEQGFHMMQSEVTQRLYKKVIGKNPLYSRGFGEEHPVAKVSWFDMIVFANALSEKEGLQTCYQVSNTQLREDYKTPMRIVSADVSWKDRSTCMGWRLPTEAEWELASGDSLHAYAGSDFFSDVGWNIRNSKGKSHNVCKKKKNLYGLCDMSGNVSEWVWDTCEGEQYCDSTNSHPLRIYKGGYWGSRDDADKLNSRRIAHPSDSSFGRGARLVRTAKLLTD